MMRFEMPSQSPLTRSSFLKHRYVDQLYGCSRAVELNLANALLLFCLSEPHGQRRAAVPNGFGAVHFLRDMEVPQRQVVEAARKNPGRHVSQGADIEFAHAITVDGLSACGEQMPRANDGNIGPEFLALLLRQGGDGGVMSADAVNQFRSLSSTLSPASATRISRSRR
jgi:hypothetical protein